MTEFRMISVTDGEPPFSLRKRDESLFSTWEQYWYSFIYSLSSVGNRQKHLFTALSKLRACKRFEKEMGREKTYRSVLI